jgi:hypothetical protein
MGARVARPARSICSRPVRRLLAVLALPLAGCARDFVPDQLVKVDSPWLAARAVWLSTGPRTEARLLLVTNARRGVRLRNALLGVAAEPPCTSDRTFVSLERDGARVERGPVDLAGPHTLGLEFRDDREFARLEAGGTVDLSLELGSGRGCVRVPLLGVASAPDWQPTEEARFAMGAEFESSFIRYRDPGNVAPVAGGGFWFGVESARNRFYLLQSAAYTSNPTSKASGHVALAAGAARKLVLAGPLAASVGAEYQADWYFARDGQSERSTRHFLHGPALAPSVSYSLQSGRHLATARGGTLSLELRAPTLLWFGAPGASGVTVVGGATVGCFGVF